MKQCPKCKAQLPENARFCLYCMTSLEEKEHIQPPVERSYRWLLVLLSLLLLGLLLLLLLRPGEKTHPQTVTPGEALELPPQTIHTTQPVTIQIDGTVKQTLDGVTYFFRQADQTDDPAMIAPENCRYYILIAAEGTPTDGVYRVPSFVNGDLEALVTAVDAGAFKDTGAAAIDLGHNVRYVWGDALDTGGLKDLYLHTDVTIAQASFLRCDGDFTIHCPEYAENREGKLWSEYAVSLGFRWQKLDYSLPEAPVTPAQPGANTTPTQPGETTVPTQPEETTSSTQPPETTVPTTTPTTPTQPPETTEATEPTKPQPTLYSVTHEGVTYTCRKVVYGDIPGYTAPNDLLLLSVTGTRSDGVYSIPYGFSIPGNSSAEIRVVGENAFRGTNARVVILGSCVNYVKTGAFDGCNLRELHLSESVNIPRAALSGCSSSMVIRSEEGAWDPVTNVQWKYQAVSYGFRWSDSAVPEEGPDSPVYTYRLATAGDNLGPNYQNDGKDIIITGLQRLGYFSSYEIPPSIDGLQVVGIDANAFVGSNVQRMYLATTIKTVKAYAFSGCALTDIYFRRNVNIDPTAFSGCPGGLTIHCPVDCSDLDQRNYSDNPELYGATWEEWNG